MRTFVIIMAGLLLYVLSLFVSGTALMYMWNWFIVPLGAIKIGFWLAFGISMTVKFFIGVHISRDKQDDSFFSNVMANILATLLIWGVGSIIQLFI